MQFLKSQTYNKIEKVMYKDMGGKKGQKGMDFKHKEVINLWEYFLEEMR